MKSTEFGEWKEKKHFYAPKAQQGQSWKVLPLGQKKSQVVLLEQE